MKIRVLSLALLWVVLMTPPASAEIKGYDDDLADSAPAVVVDVHSADGSRGIPPEYSDCPAQPNPVNTVFAAGFTSGYAFGPVNAAASSVGIQTLGVPRPARLFGLEYQDTDIFLYALADEFCATGARLGAQPVGHPNLESLAYSCHDGFLYSAAFDTEAHEGYLVRIDPATGIGEPVGEHRMARDVWIVGLAYDDEEGVFYGITNGFAGRDFQEVFEITPGGVEKIIGPTGSGSQVLQSLLIEVDGRLLAGGRRLYEINRATGEASPVGSLEFPGTLWALADRGEGCAAVRTPTTPTLPSPTPTPNATATETRRVPTATATARRTVVTTGGIGAADATIFVDDTSALPERGTMRIDDEIIRYDGLQVIQALGTGGGLLPGALLNVERGVGGTTPADHPSGSVLVLLAAGCPGDCDGNGHVSVGELVAGVNIALGSAATDSCFAIDDNFDGAVWVSELVGAVNTKLTDCT